MIEEILEELKIEYELLKHDPLYTVSDAQIIKDKIKGVGVKNLFLKDKDKNYFLVLIKDDKKLNIRNLENKLRLKNITFASLDELKKILNLEKGSVTPLAIINDKENIVKIVIDKELENNWVLVHPLVNTKTISLQFRDLIKFIKYYNHEYIILDL